MFNQYPYLNLNDLNLDYLLSEIKKMYNEVTNFVSINAIKYADPIQWNITSQYEKNTVVIDPLTGTAYISVAAVPSGVALTRTEYWTVVFDLGSFVTRAAQNFTSHWESDTTTTATFPTTTGGWLVWGDVLYKALTNITAGDTYVIDGNIKHFTIEDLYNAYLNTIANILTMVGDLADLTTADRTSIVNAINEVVGNIGNLADLITTDKDSVVDAINEVTNRINELLIASITLNVPADYATVADALEEIKNKFVGENVIIKVADGSYTGNMLRLVNYDFSRVSLIGNTTDPELCTITLQGNETAFRLTNAHLGYIDGFKVIANERNSDNTWNNKPNGVWLDDSSTTFLGKSMIFDGCYYGVYSQSGSNIIIEEGQSVTTTDIASMTINNVVSLRKAKNLIVLNAGDVGIFAYVNSSIITRASISCGANDATLGLGFGFLAEHSSALRAYNCVAISNLSGFAASDSSAIIAHDNCMSKLNGLGMQSNLNSNGEFIDANIYNCTNGIHADGGYCVCRNVATHNCDNGMVSVNGGFIKCDRDNNCYDCTGYGYFSDRLSQMHGKTHMLGTTTGAALVRLMVDYDTAPPSQGTRYIGDLVFNTNPSTGIAGWICTRTGDPATWSEIPTRNYFALPTVGTGYQTAGTAIFDVTNNKPIYFDGTHWVYATDSIRTTPPPVIKNGACYFNETHGKPLWYFNGSWVDGTGASV